MDSQATTVIHYVILIGIDDYPDRPLKSCVNDVEDTKEFLKGTLKDSIKVWAYIASQSDRKSRDLAQDPTLCPTRENVTSAFESVISLSKARDYVYSITLGTVLKNRRLVTSPTSLQVIWR